MNGSESNLTREIIDTTIHTGLVDLEVHGDGGIGAWNEVSHSSLAGVVSDRGLEIGCSGKVHTTIELSA